MGRAKGEAKRLRAGLPRWIHQSTRMVPTSDDWHPSFFPDVPVGEYADRSRTDGFVELRMFLQEGNPGSEIPYWFRISAWGNDDTGMCLDRNFEDLDEAEREWDRWTSWLSTQGLITYDGLRLVGFRFD